ncbi:hypothetical protein CDAR_408051 [Caerostris darwini]|uniref:Uncharacterized protein n=1 Tax=Caerostris darwini TaxID=1538125 RepID=A0AAV4TJS8_9ARAC|nr:hypothetical protein CDAR_408051 [Caerostris darwini]
MIVFLIRSILFRSIENELVFSEEPYHIRRYVPAVEEWNVSHIVEMGRQSVVFFKSFNESRDSSNCISNYYSFSFTTQVALGRIKGRKLLGDNVCADKCTYT